MNRLVEELKGTGKIYTENGFYVIEREADGKSYTIYPTERAKNPENVVRNIQGERAAVEKAIKMENEEISKNLGVK